jgi:4-amino-4-deoxy-L-arabinose transferase-like glycosyltransferase
MRSGREPRSSTNFLDLIFLAALTLVACLPLLTKYPSPGADEPGFVDVAVNVARHGAIATDAYIGLLPGAERHVYWQPPVYFITLAACFKIFGIGLVQARLFSLMCGVAVVILTYLLARRHADRIPALIASGLLAISYWLVNPARFARMDVLCVALIVATVLTYQVALTRPRLAWFAFSGILAGLAFVTHPIGVVAVATLSTHLVIQHPSRAWRDPRLYLVVACFTAAALLWVIYILQDLASFRLQMAAQLQRKQQLGSYFNQFWTAKTHAITLGAMCGFVIYTIANTWRDHARNVIPVAFLFAFVAATYGRETGYFQYFFPFGCCAIAAGVSRMSALRSVGYAVVVLALVNEGAILGVYIKRYHHRDYGAVERAVAAAIPPGKMVFLGPSDVSPYFALLGRNPMRIMVPTGTEDPHAHRRVAEACDYVAATPPVAYLPDLAETLDSASPIVTVDQGIGYRLSIYDARLLRDKTHQ